MQEAAGPGGSLEPATPRTDAKGGRAVKRNEPAMRGLMTKIRVERAVLLLSGVDGRVLHGLSLHVGTGLGDGQHLAVGRHGHLGHHGRLAVPLPGVVIGIVVDLHR